MFSASARTVHYSILISAAFALFFANLGGASLWDVDEGRNATAALEMLETGDWIVPTFNANLRVDKPALLYWLQIAAYRTFGVSEFSARLPSALAALLTVLIVYELARAMFGASTGLLAGLIAASSPMLCGAARFANPDALLHCFTVLTLTLFWLGQSWPRTLWFVAMGVSTGLAMLAKGPVGLALPGGVVLLFLGWEKRLGVLWDRRLGWGILAFLLVAAPWYVLVGVETKGAFLRGFFFRHNVERFVAPMENHAGFPGYYLLVLIAGMAPWSIFLGLSWWYASWSALRQPWQRFRTAWEHACDGPHPLHPLTPNPSPLQGRGEPQAPGRYRFLWCWMLLYLVFFSIAATKLPNYVLPAIGPAAILVARMLVRWQAGEIQPSRIWLHLCLGGMVLVGVAFGAGLLIASGTWPLAALRGRFFPGLENWAWVGLLPIAGAALAWLFLLRDRRRAVVLTTVAMALALLGPLAGWVSAAFERFKATRSLVEIAGALDLEDDMLIGGWQVEYLPSLNFYVRRDVMHHENEADARTFLGRHVRVYLFVPARIWETWTNLPPGVRVAGRWHDLYRHQEIVAVTNR